MEMCTNVVELKAHELIHVIQSSATSTTGEKDCFIGLFSSVGCYMKLQKEDFKPEIQVQCEVQLERK